MSNTPTDKQIADMQNILRIQGDNGNWDTSDYMCGMFNGMELMMATMEDREPKFRSFDKPGAHDALNNGQVVSEDPMPGDSNARP